MRYGVDTNEAWNNKGQQLQKYEAQSNGYSEMHFSTMKSIHLWSFKLIALILYEIWSEHEWSMKINKGQ